MPIPFIVAGLAVGALGIGGHLSAKETNEKAQNIADEAKELYDSAKRSLESSQRKTEKELLKLGYAKKETLEHSIKQFLASYDKVKNIQLKESLGLNEISKFTLNEQDEIELRELTDIYSSTVSSSATGVAAGTIIALATSGSLSLVTGGLATAGSALAAGQIGAAAGIAGSALSFGAAMTPLSAIAAPIVLFTGISASMKADENLEKAETMMAEATAAVEKMKTTETLCKAITKRANMFHGVLTEWNKLFSECLMKMDVLIQKKEKIALKKGKKELTLEDFTEEEQELLATTRSVAAVVKSVIDTPILTKEGTLSPDSESIYDKTTEKNKLLVDRVNKVISIDYGIKPNSTQQSTLKKENTTKLFLFRCVFISTLFSFLNFRIIGIAFHHKIHIKQLISLTK